MIMRDFTEENLKEVLTKMFEAVGAKYSPELTLNERWYLKYSWTRAQEDAFKKWLVEYIKKGRFTSSKKRAEREAEIFLLHCGWPLKEK